jgi:hypothetical protein
MRCSLSEPLELRGSLPRWVLWLGLRLGWFSPSPPPPEASATLDSDEGSEPPPPHTTEAIQLLSEVAEALASDQVEGFVIFVQRDDETHTWVYNTGRQDPNAMLWNLDEYRGRLRKFIARHEGTAPLNNRSHSEH